MSTTLDSEYLLGITEKLKDGLRDFSTGGQWNDDDYKKIRQELFRQEVIRHLIPGSVSKCRDLGDYWQYMKSKLKTYAERRSFLIEEFEPLLNFLELKASSSTEELDIKDKVVKWLIEGGESDLAEKLESCDIQVTESTNDWGNSYLEVVLYAPRKFYDEIDEPLRNHIQSNFTECSRPEYPSVYIQVVPKVGGEVLKILEPQIIQLNSDQINNTWKKLLSRSENDPEGAITLSKTLVEDVCKHILDEMGVTYDDKKEDLIGLYAKVADNLSLSPQQYNEKIFKQILGGCTSVVSGLANIRNNLGDSHGKGKTGVKPAKRHAQLAVNLSASIVLFLLATWENKTIKICP